MAARKPAPAPAAPIQTTVADAHRLMISNATRRADDAQREVKLEAARAMQRLEALMRRLELGEVAELSDVPDTSDLTTKVVAARLAHSNLRDIEGYIAMINA